MLVTLVILGLSVVGVSLSFVLAFLVLSEARHIAAEKSREQECMSTGTEPQGGAGRWGGPGNVFITHVPGGVVIRDCTHSENAR